MPVRSASDQRSTPDAPRLDEARGPGRPKDLAKRAAILEAAKVLFMAQGFDGVSMDQIAAGAGVSKLTVYSHFGDKHTLFAQAIASKCHEQMPDALFATPTTGTCGEQLTQIARAFFALITSPEAMAMHRMMAAPGTDQRLQELFWAAGPQRVQAAFAAYLQRCADSGQLMIPDVPRAASQFFALLKGEMHTLMMCGLCTGPAPRDVDAHIAATVDLFLRAHARNAAPAA